MAKEYIERDAFIAGQRHLYCENCERRKGMKNGKMKFLYAIGEVPCRACDIGDMIDSIEDYPAADVSHVRHGQWKCHGDCGVTECSACGWSIEEYVGDYSYCPECGARMDGGAG